ncbi:MAG TPA: DUF6624 domain-containing protein [Gemmatimonadales bacterium]|nr:DUF6624 domain-containing protein [Gemmatimonadales bacterium]
MPRCLKLIRGMLGTGLAAALGACRPGAHDPPAAVLAEARREQAERGKTDQAVREGFGTGGVVDLAQIRVMAHTDSANTNWLKAYVARWGWPTTAQVGAEAVENAFLIVQHAVHDTAFMHAMLPAIQQAYRRGDLKGGEVALLTDRLEVKAGRGQVYGTQLSLKDGRLVLDPIADSAGVDARRRRMGLPPLAVYLRYADSMLRMEPAPPPGKRP